LKQLSTWGMKFEGEIQELLAQLQKLSSLSKRKIIERMKQLLSRKTVV
jgi:hypothetical protein